MDEVADFRLSLSIATFSTYSFVEHMLMVDVNSVSPCFTMKIIDALSVLDEAQEPYFSLEFFPPKTDMVFLCIV
jgi:hypothetical protein